MNALTNHLTNYRSFNIFIITSGVAYFLTLRTGYERLAEILVAGFLALLTITFIVFIISATIHEYDEKDPLIVRLGGILLFYLICIINQSAALYIWLIRHGNFTHPYLLLSVFAWLLFYIIGLFIIYKTKKG